jgi:hypothetical protein
MHEFTIWYPLHSVGEYQDCGCGDIQYSDMCDRTDTIMNRNIVFRKEKRRNSRHAVIRPSINTSGRRAHSSVNQ